MRKLAQKLIKTPLRALVLIGLFLGRCAYAEPTFEKDIKPLFAEYCYSCHGEDRIRGDLDLTIYLSKDQIFADRDIWLSVHEQIETEEMPTKGPEPTNAERVLMMEWIDQTLNEVDWSKVKHAGHVRMPLLNKREYNNTMRDLLGMDLTPGSSFTDDSEGESGFSTDRENLFLTPTALEKYFQAAETALSTLAKGGIKPADYKLESEKMRVTEMKAKPLDLGGGAKGYNLKIGQMTLYEYFDLPAAGVYEVSVRGVPMHADTDGHIHLRVNNEIKGLLSFPQRKLETQKLRVSLPKGSLQFSFNLATSAVKKKTKTKKFRGATGVDWVQVRGPLKSVTKVSQDLVFSVAPELKNDPEKRAHKIITRFAERAARRPLDEKTLQNYIDVFNYAIVRGGNYQDSLQLALTAILVSPNFLYRHEFAPRPDTKEDYPLDDYQVANRLSYFLWMSMPDQELMALAKAGKLRDEATLRAQVQRMLRSSKARSFTETFLGQWLGFASVGESVIPDEKIFPAFTPKLAYAMKQETILTFEHLLRKNGSLLHLIDSRATYLNETLAKHYKIEGITGEHMRAYRVKTTDRGGLLGMASILTATSTPTRTSPVLRGLWVAETLLGDRVPEAPADVPELTEQAGLKKKLTLRQELEEHRRKPDCAICHDKIDPIGFGLENFDAIGRFRLKETGGRNIDASGEMDGFKFTGIGELKAWLLEHRKEEFIRNVTERTLSFALGRKLETYDEGPLRQITAALAEKDYLGSLLIEEIVLSYPFLHQNNSIKINE